MLSWITPSQRLIPHELINAYNANRRRMRIDRYRSRTDVIDEHINTAYAWLRLPIVRAVELIDNPYKESFTIYKTMAVPRGVEEQEASRIVRDTISSVINDNRKLNIIMLNTGTAAAASACIKDFFDNNELWTEIDIKTLVTSSATHKVNMYKHVLNLNNNNTTYVILNNLDTPSVLFKIATAIMIDLNAFEDDTEKFASAWLNGNADTIYDTVTNYYAEYKRNKALMERMKAIEMLGKNMGADREQEFRNRIQALENDMSDIMANLRTCTNRMNEVKGEYLLYMLEDDTKKTEELKTFFKTIGDKLHTVKYRENQLIIVYKTKLVYFEPELLNRYFDSIRPNCVKRAKPHIQQLLKDIFLEHKYNLLIESGACIYTHDNNITYVSPESYIETMSELLGIPNPHHKYYNCWGDNKPSIVNALIHKDYITAISQIFAAMSGLNIADTAVMEKFVLDELEIYEDTPCLEDKTTGEIITVGDYKRRFEDASNETNE